MSTASAASLLNVTNVCFVTYVASCFFLVGDVLQNTQKLLNTWKDTFVSSVANSALLDALNRAMADGRFCATATICQSVAGSLDARKSLHREHVTRVEHSSTESGSHK